MQIDLIKTIGIIGVIIIVLACVLKGSDANIIYFGLGGIIGVLGPQMQTSINLQKNSSGDD